MIFTGFQNLPNLTYMLVAQDNCSYCNEPLTAGPFVVWHCHHTDLWLHRTCAIHFATNLREDAETILQMDKRKKT